ncbi:response regulator [Aquabacterium sp. A7-Y]|nr:response regulator [Aquabacterium sp. A7-Y]
MSAASASSSDLRDTQAGREPLRVLVAEDDRVQQILLCTHLEACGCLVDIAEDGHDALEMWQAHRHRLVITDCRMPRMDGYELAKALRADPAGADVRLVGTSADTEDAPLALAAGMEQLLQKPVSGAQIAALCAAVKGS